MPVRILSGLIGLFFLVQGIGWLFDPAGAAGALGMPLLDGVGRSTQVGDLSAFFLCLGGFATYGAYARNPVLIRAAACLIGLPAATRAIAWAAHDAPFATQFIAIEFVSSAALFFLASRRDAAQPN